MKRRGGLTDRLHQEMIASNRGWTAEEIVRFALKIVSERSRAERLVGAILAGDGRFHRKGSTWRALETSAPRLDSLPFLLVDAPRPRRPGSLVPLWFQPFERTQSVAEEVVEIGPDGSGVERVGVWLDRCLVASLNAPAVRRQLHILERLHALPAASESLLDLALFLQRWGEDLPEPCTPDSSASPSERLHACRLVLDRVLGEWGAWPLARVEEEIESDRRGEPVDFSGFRFGPERLGEIPSRPGIYRFLGEGGRLLYVGKSRDLRRRIAGYFRPVAPDHLRRARLLAEVRDLEWEVTPCELEALILEGEAIRTGHPAHNQQIEAHSGGEVAAGQDRDLVFVLCEGESEEVSLFFLRGGHAWARSRLPRDPSSLDAKKVRSLAAGWFSATIETGLLTPIDPPEGPLVLRYLKLFGDRLDRIRLADFGGPEEIAEALFDLAVRPRPSGDPWVVRAPRSNSR